jgi:hypothetical protein
MPCKSSTVWVSKTFLRSGCLGRLLSLGELTDGGGRGERPLEKTWRTRAQLASQHRGRHCGEEACVVGGGGTVERFGSESAARVQSAFGCLSPPSHSTSSLHEVRYGNNARPLRRSPHSRVTRNHAPCTAGEGRITISTNYLQSSNLSHYAFVRIKRPDSS